MWLFKPVIFAGVFIISLVLLLNNIQNPNVIGIGSIPESLHTTNVLLAGQVMRPGDYIQLVDFGHYFVTGDLVLRLPCNANGYPLAVPVGGDIDPDVNHTYMTQIPLTIITHASNNGTSCMYNSTINAIDLVCTGDQNANAGYNNCPISQRPIPPRVTAIGLLNTNDHNIVFRTGNSMMFTLSGVVGDISVGINHYGHPTNLPESNSYHENLTFSDLDGQQALLVGGTTTAPSCQNAVHNHATHSDLDIDGDEQPFGCDDENSLIGFLNDYLDSQENFVNYYELATQNGVSFTFNGIGESGNGFATSGTDSDGDGFANDIDTCPSWDLKDKTDGSNEPLDVDGDGISYSCDRTDEMALLFP